MVKLADLKPDRNNARKHNPRNIGMVANSLREVGAARSGVIDEDGNILAGNGTYEALSEAGIEKVKIVQADGNEWVVVQRKGLSEKQKLKLALYDNRSAELAEWDKEVLADIDPEIMESMFSTDELEDLLDNVGGSEGLDGEDDVPEAPEKAISQLGDLYQLGGHRLLCGDSTAKDAVDKLMDGKKADMVFTDPPYGVDYTGGPGREREKLKGDHKGTSIYTDVIPVIAEFCNGPCYVWYAGTKPNELYEAVGKCGEIHALIIWVKNNATFNMNIQYKQKHEPCLYWKPKGATLRWSGGNTATTVWEIDRESRNDFHPTQKPVELAEKAIGNHKAKTVLDLFGGSGATMVASEKLNRKCYMMELDTKYCDVIVKRFNDLFPDIEILRNGEAFEPIHD